MATVHQLSVIPLYIEVFAYSAVISNATAFIVEHKDRCFLITNWHVLSGRHADTRGLLSTTGAEPTSINVWHHDETQFGKWGAPLNYLLRNSDGQPLWKELAMPDGRMHDVVALQISKYEGYKFYPLDLELANTDLPLAPSEPVSIIGFPFGRASDGKFPIYKTGHIASDLDLDADGKPAFLIDTTTKVGMSGSPVIALRTGSYRTSTAALSVGGQAMRFMGVYGSRLSDDEKLKESNLGLVWKPSVLLQLLGE